MRLDVYAFEKKNRRAIKMIAIRGPGSEKWRFEICRRAPGASILQKIGKGHREPSPVFNINRLLMQKGQRF